MHRAVRSVPEDNSDLPPLPSSVVSLDGQIVHTDAECWRFRSSSDGGKVIVIPWNRLDEVAATSDRETSDIVTPMIPARSRFTFTSTVG